MLAADNANIVIGQTPVLEKIQQPQNQNPEHSRNHLAVQAAEENRLKAEAVPEAAETNQGNKIDREKRESKGDQPGRKANSNNSDETEEAAPKNDADAIVNVTI